MPLFTPAQRRLCSALARVGYVNPFLPERIELERQILGEKFTAAHMVWSLPQAMPEINANLRQIDAWTVDLVHDAAKRLADGATYDPSELELYADTALYCLFNEYRINL